MSVNYCRLTHSFLFPGYRSFVKVPCRSQSNTRFPAAAACDTLGYGNQTVKAKVKASGEKKRGKASIKPPSNVDVVGGLVCNGSNVGSVAQNGLVWFNK